MKIKNLFVSLFLLLQFSLCAQMYSSSSVRLYGITQVDSIQKWDFISSKTQDNLFIITGSYFYWRNGERSVKLKIYNEEYINGIRSLSLRSSEYKYDFAIISKGEIIVPHTSEEEGTIFMVFKIDNKF